MNPGVGRKAAVAIREILTSFLPHTKENREILEIGCGMGANIQLIQDLGYEFYGIDFSKFAINKILKEHQELSGSLKTGDFTKSIKLEFCLICFFFKIVTNLFVN